MSSSETVLALVALVGGAAAARALLPLWYRRAVLAQMRRRTARDAAPVERRPAAPGGAGAAEVELLEMSRWRGASLRSDAEGPRAVVGAASRRRLVLRSVALVLASLVQAAVLLAWVEPAPPGVPAITASGLLVAGLLAAVVPVFLALRSLISYAQLSTMGSWWLLAVPVGAGLGANVWVTLSVLGAVRARVALVAFAIVAAICWAILLVLLTSLRALRRLVDVSADGFSFLLAAALGTLFAALVFSGSPDGHAWLLFAAPLPVYAGAVLLPGLSRSDRPARTLLFLRTFDGPRSLLPGLCRRWLDVGEVHLLAGPDLATRTASAEGVLALVTGRLGRHFVAGPDDLARRLAAARRRPARDGRYDVREFPCLADAWQPTLTRLASEADAILLDLRGFTAASAGCTFELETLAALGALEKTLVVTDPAADKAAARAAVARGSSSAPRGEPVALRVWSADAEEVPDPDALLAALLSQGRDGSRRAAVARG